MSTEVEAREVQQTPVSDTAGPVSMPESLLHVREQFPIFSRTVHDVPLVYLDTAATSQKPARVIERLARFYREEYGTVRRGAYLLCQQSTAMFECARKKVAAFINASSPDEIIFLRGVTEAINLVAVSFSRGLFREGDEVIISAMEHHANIVPWQLVQERCGIRIRVIPMDARGELILEEYEKLLNPRTKLVSVTHVANSLGTINPIARISAMAHAHGAYVLVDGAQAVPHLPVDVEALGCDLYAASGHKMYGPTGAGFLYGRKEVLELMPPFLGGGEMIDKVTFESTTFEEPPHRFEAGTPPIAEVIGMAEAIDFMRESGMEQIRQLDEALLAYATPRLLEVPGLRIIGEARAKSGLIAFTMAGAHPFDIAAILDRKGVAVRAGHHCAQPVMRSFDVPATVRASFGIYTVKEDIDALVDGLLLARDMLA